MTASLRKIAQHGSGQRIELFGERCPVKRAERTLAEPLLADLNL
jgi:hypothetical protein